MALRIMAGSAALAVGATLVIAGVVNGGEAARPMNEIAVRVEKVCEKVSANTIHGWQTCRLVKFGGSLYASAGALRPGEGPGDMLASGPGLVFRRDPDGKWAQVAELKARTYSWCLAPDGAFWIIGPASYNDCKTYRTAAPKDFANLEQVYQGTCAYLGASVSPEGNFLLLHAENLRIEGFVPNAVIAAFYDRKAGRWHQSRLETPEGRYGYEGILVRGQTALAVLNSAILDKAANPVPPHYSWRHVRLARCDDLTKGQWVNKPWLMPKYGNTALQDLIRGPDGSAYLAYSHRASEGSWEEAEKAPLLHYIARIGDDLKVDTFPTGIDAASTRILVDGAKNWYLVGRPAPKKNLRLWKLDPEAGFKAVKEYELPGTDVLEGYVIHTLRPERFGGEGDGDTVHLLSVKHVYQADGKTVAHGELWHAAFDLPKAPQALRARMELVSAEVNPSSIHGWHTCKLLKHKGELYALAMKARPAAPPPNLKTEQDLWGLEGGQFFRRGPEGRWELMATVAPRVYSMSIDPAGQFWLGAAAWYTSTEIQRSRRPLDLGSIEEVHRGTSAYLSNAVSPEGNFQTLYAEDTNSMQAFTPNAITAAFYEKQTGQWHRQRIETPEGRYGYEGIILRGRQALVVMNSAIADPKANPVAPHYSWRHVRLLRCEDLARGTWVNKPWLMPEYGETPLHDLSVGPDGQAYLVYSTRHGASLAAVKDQPMSTVVARIQNDLRVEDFATGLHLNNPALLFFNSKRAPFLLGKPQAGADLHLWRLDPGSFKPLEEYQVEGTAKLEGYIVHTLRPERFGGEPNTDTVHLLSCKFNPGPDGKPGRTAELWYGAVDLPR